MEVLHTCGLTEVLQIVYVVTTVPLKAGFGTKVYCPVVGLIVRVPVVGFKAVTVVE